MLSCVRRVRPKCNVKFQISAPCDPAFILRPMHRFSQCCQLRRVVRPRFGSNKLCSVLFHLNLPPALANQVLVVLLFVDHKCPSAWLVRLSGSITVYKKFNHPLFLQLVAPSTCPAPTCVHLLVASVACDSAPFQSELGTGAPCANAKIALALMPRRQAFFCSENALRHCTLHALNPISVASALVAA